MPLAWKIGGWNVNGLRAVARKGALAEYLERQSPDVLCLTETKLSDNPRDAFAHRDYPHQHFHISTAKKGYSGTAVWSKIPPKRVVDEQLGVEEGRVIVAEFEPFVVVCVYTPNSGEGLKRLSFRTEEWDVRFAEMLARIERPVVVVGDLNCARHPIDVHDPTRCARIAGYTPQERQSFEIVLARRRLVDSFRLLHPHASDAYSYWSYRQRARLNNRGWRIDYVLVSEEIAVAAADIDAEQMGSDHCPVHAVIGLKAGAQKEKEPEGAITQTPTAPPPSPPASSVRT